MDFDPRVQEFLFWFGEFSEYRFFIKKADGCSLVLNHGDEAWLMVRLFMPGEAHNDAIEGGDDFEILCGNRLANGLFV